MPPDDLSENELTTPRRTKAKRVPYLLPSFTEPYVSALTVLPSGQTSNLYLRLDQSAVNTASTSLSASWSGSFTNYTGANAKALLQEPKTPLTVESYAGAGGTGSWLGVGTQAWTNPGNITSENSVYATCSVGGDSIVNAMSSQVLKSSSHGFNVPSTATIVGIEVTIRAKHTANCRFDQVRLTKTGTGGAGTSQDADEALTTTDTDYVFGGPTNLWGTTWTYSDINSSNFGVGATFFCSNTLTSQTVSVDSIRIKVYLSYASGGQDTATETWGGLSKLASETWLQGQFVTPPIVGKTISSGNYTVAFAATSPSAGSNLKWTGKAALYHMRGGSKQTTVFDVSTIGSVDRTSTSELTCYVASVSGAGFTIISGDYLQLEIGLRVNNTAGVSIGGFNTSIHTGGTTAITSDEAATSSPLSLLGLPTTIVLMQQGAVPLVSSSTVTATGRVTRAGRASLQGSSSVGAGARSMVLGSALLSGRATVTASSTKYVRGSAALSGRAAASPSGISYVRGVGTLSGRTTLAGVSSNLSIASAALSAIASLVGNPLSMSLARASLVSNSTVSGQALSMVSGRASLLVTTTTGVTSGVTHRTTGVLSVVSSVSSGGRVYRNGALSLSSVASVNAVGTVNHRARASLASSARIIGNPPIGCAFVSNGTLTGRASVQHVAAASLSVVSSAQAFAKRQVFGNAALLSSASLSAISNRTVRASAGLLSQASTSATSVVNHAARASLQSLAQLNSGSQSLAPAQAALTASAALQASGLSRVNGSAALSAASGTAANATNFVLSSSAMTARSIIGASGLITRYSHASLITRATLTGQPTAGQMFGSASLHSGASLTPRGSVIYSARAAIQGDSGFAVPSVGLLQSGVFGGIVSSSVLALGSSVYSNEATLLSRTSVTSSPIATYAGRANLSALSTTNARASKAADGIASLGVESTVSVTGQSLVLESTTLSGLTTLSASAVRVQNASVTGGAVAGGVAKIESPRYNYRPSIPDTYIEFEGSATASQSWSYTGSGEIEEFTGTAPFKVGYRYVPQGHIEFTGTQPDNPYISYTRGFGFYWRVNQSATAGFDFFWAVGKQRKYWYRVLGQARNDVCDPIGGDDCCKTIVITIMATSVEEVCQKIKERFGVWPIKSIQRFSKPAENSAVRQDEANGILYECNELIDEPFCNIPPCASFCVEYNVKETWGFTDRVDLVMRIAQLETPLVEALTVHDFAYEADGGISFGGDAETAITLRAEAKPRKLGFGGSAEVRSTNYTYASSGRLKFGGSATTAASHWKHEGGAWSTTHTSDNLRVSEEGDGSSWKIGNGVYTSDMSSEPSKTLWFTLDDTSVPYGQELSGVIVTFQRHSNGLVRDAEILIKVGDKIVKDLAKTNLNWPIALPVMTSYGNGNDTLGYVVGQPFSIGIRVKPVSHRDGLVSTITKPVVHRVCDRGGRLRFSGSAEVKASHWSYVGEGGVSFSGEAEIRETTRRRKQKIERPSFALSTEPEVKKQSVSKRSLRPSVDIVKALSTEINTTITHIGQQIVPELLPTTDTVTECSCSGMPLSLPMSHNLSRNNKLAEFAVRNGLTIPTYVYMDYNRINDAWQSNLHYQGVSTSSLRNETWTILFDLQCTQNLGGVHIGKNVWKFGMKTRQRNLVTGESLETRLMVAFLPDATCSQGKDFRFKLFLDTQMKKARIDPSSFIYDMVVYDSLGLFKTAQWIDKPELVIDMTQTGVPLPIPRYPIALGANT